jgi:hypothetical protein
MQLTLPALRANRTPKVSQERLAQLAQEHLPPGRTISAARILQIEKNYRKPADVDERAAIAAALGVTVADILWGDESGVVPEARTA